MKTHIIYLLFTFCILSGIYAQNMNISGRVTDGKGEPLAFANIVIVQDKDSMTFAGTVTDMEGNFMLETTKENPIVKVSYLGYVTTSVAVKQNVLNTIKLEEDTNLLGEVVVRGTRQHFKMERWHCYGSGKQPAEECGYGQRCSGKATFYREKWRCHQCIG